MFATAHKPQIQMSHEGDGLLTRGDIEIELARFVLAVGRRRSESLARCGESDDRYAAWFHEAALDLLQRAAPDLRGLLTERLQQIACANGGLRLEPLEIDADSLAFASIRSTAGMRDLRSA